jgi:hypothetical protein
LASTLRLTRSPWMSFSLERSSSASLHTHDTAHVLSIATYNSSRLCSHSSRRTARMRSILS